MVSGVRSSRFNRNLHKNQMRYFNSVNGKSKPIIWQFVMPIIKYIKRIVFEQCTLNERLCFYRSQAWHIAKYETIWYPNSQNHHCSKSNQWIWLISLNLDSNTWIMISLEFKWNRNDLKCDLNNLIIETVVVD